jgi:hypothetical protein
MSYGYDEFESKVGQFIYTMVMYERLRDYLIEKLRGKDRVSLRIGLGTDKSGNHVFMDILLTSVRPQMLVQVGEPRTSRGKRLFMVLSNEEVSGDNRQIAMEMEKLVLESLKWWHGYFGERDKLRLGDWRSEVVEVVDGEVVETVLEIPVNRIIMPREEIPGIPEAKLSRLAEFADLLPPIRVRMNESGYYELVSGAYILNLLVNNLGRDRVRAVLVDTGRARGGGGADDLDSMVEKLIELIS